MLMIRLQRVGRTNDPAFRLVLAEKRSKPKSGELEILGSYHPKTKATILKNERIVYWLSKGAKLSATAHNLLIAKSVIQGKKINPHTFSRDTELRGKDLKPLFIPVAKPQGILEGVRINMVPVKMVKSEVNPVRDAERNNLGDNNEDKNF